MEKAERCEYVPGALYVCIYVCVFAKNVFTKDA